MSTTPARNLSQIAIAIVIGAVIIAASVLSYASFQSTVTKTATSTQVSTSTLTTTSTLISTSTITTTCIQGSTNLVNAATVQESLPVYNSTTDCQLGLTLSLGANLGAIVGTNETIILSLTNDEAAARNVNYTTFPTLPHALDPTSIQAFDDVLPALPPCGFPSVDYVPAFVAIYNSSGVPLQLSDTPPSIVACPYYMPSNQYHSFNASQTINETLSIGGHWTSHDISEPWINATYSQFIPGDYTIIAFDPWGQMTELNFTVAPATSTPVQVVSITGPIPPYNPGGPVVSIVLQNVGDISIVSLKATLVLSAAITTGATAPYPFVFDVNASSPLHSGQTISSTRTLIGAGFSSGADYSLTIDGTFANGTAFSSTVLVQVVPPTNSSSSA